MRRGTTPSITVTIDGLALADITVATLWLTFEQGGQLLTKELSDVAIDVENNTITIRLNQSETLMFSRGPVAAQIRILDSAGIAYATDIMTLQMDNILKDGEIT